MNVSVIVFMNTIHIFYNELMDKIEADGDRKMLLFGQKEGNCIKIC